MQARSSWGYAVSECLFVDAIVFSLTAGFLVAKRPPPSGVEAGNLRRTGRPSNRLAKKNSKDELRTTTFMGEESFSQASISDRG